MPRKIVYASRMDFVSEYLGKTKDKTREFLIKNLGSNIIVKDKIRMDLDDTYGQEAMEEITNFLATGKDISLSIGHYTYGTTW